MKRKKTWALLLIMAFMFAMPEVAEAAAKPSLQLSAKPSKVMVGQQLIVEILVKNAPPIYGADVQIRFDPNALEVLDNDPATAGIQFRAGSFIDPAKSFPLQYKVDNENGTIDYALTLLNPAPDAGGSGQLALITFQARVAGKTTIKISEGMFGTRTGETISPDLASVQISVVDQNGNPASPAAGSAPTNKSGLLLGLGAAVLAIIVFVGLLIRLKTRRPG